MKFNPFDDSIYPAPDKAKEEPFRVQKTDKTDSLHPKNTITDERRKRENSRKNPGEQNRSHFRELAEAAERAHAKLVKSGNPYRFCVYEEDSEIMIDIIKLDKDGKPGRVIKKDITREDFFKWIDCIETGDGLVFDKEA